MMGGRIKKSEGMTSMRIYKKLVKFLS